MDDGIHSGHRARMRRKFLDFGGRVFDTYELLEMLLYHTVPVKDTNPIAKRLLSRFGSLDGVLSATTEELCEVDGVGKKTAELILAASRMMTSFDESGAEESGIFDDYYALGDKILEYPWGNGDYKTVLLSFDNDMKLIGTDEICGCDYASGAIKPKLFIDALIKRGAAVAVIAHNHPHGPLYPTEGDRETNNMIEIALYNVGVFLLEHYIVCGERFVGFMNHISEAFRQMPSASKFYESKRRTCE